MLTLRDATDDALFNRIKRVLPKIEEKLDAQRQEQNGGDNGQKVLKAYLGDTDREHFVVFMLDRKNKLIGIDTVSIGSLTASVVHPREDEAIS